MPGEAATVEQRVRVFISHATRERDWARRLASILPDSMYRVLVASAEPGDPAEGLRLGDSWAERLDGEIRLSDLFVVLLSSTSCASPAVFHEVNIAHLTRLTTNNRRPINLKQK